MNRRRIVFTVLVVTLALLFLGGSTLFAAPKTFAFFIAHQGNSFMAGLAQNMEAAGKAAGVNIKVYTADNDPAKQNSQVDNAIALKVDGLMLDPVSFDGLTASVRAAVAAKIPIITVHESVANQDLAASYVGIDLKQVGIDRMNLVVKDLNGKGNIAHVQGALGHPAQIQIGEGGDEVLKKNPGIKVVFEGTGNWVAPDAMSLVENWLSTGKQIDAIDCDNDGMAMGVLQALRSVKKIGQIKVYGGDAPPEAMKAIKAGEEAGSILIDSKAESKVAVATMIAVSEGKTVPKTVMVPLVTVTKENVDQYYSGN